jgi:FkbM family methyltransferase
LSTFITYAQNFEDVLLWRALRHVERGTYVDVGAYDPVSDSVSKAFYERGWRGIHVEPVSEYAERLRRDRPDETVIEAALGSETGSLELFEIPDTGMSTCIPEIADNCRRLGYAVHQTTVPCLRLDEVLDQVTGDAIHWLKIDVEGAEERVLSGWNGAKRPWIIVIEAIKPLSEEELHQNWEPILLEKGYRMAFADGLNRYYLSSEHADLQHSFRYGANVLDGFEASETCWISRAVVREHKRHLAELATRHSVRLEELSRRVGQLESDIAEIAEIVQIADIAEHLAVLRTEAAAALAMDAEQADRISSEIDRLARRQAPFAAIATWFGLHRAPSAARSAANAMDTAALTVDQLLMSYDEDFIQAAYRALLRRVPDPSGMNHYLGRIRAGTSRQDILLQLRLSSEGERVKAAVPGMEALLRRHRLIKTPLIGPVMRWMGFERTRRDALEGLRAIECRARGIAVESQDRLDRIDAACRETARRRAALEVALRASQAGLPAEPHAGQSSTKSSEG